MRIDTENATDKQMAEATAICLDWLSEKGREGAQILQTEIASWPNFNLEEAMAWLDAIESGTEI